MTPLGTICCGLMCQTDTSGCGWWSHVHSPIPISPFEKEIAAQAIGDSYPGQSSASFVGGMSSKTFSETFSKGVKPG
jgi:hypothetical protein